MARDGLRRLQHLRGCIRCFRQRVDVEYPSLSNLRRKPHQRQRAVSSQMLSAQSWISFPPFWNTLVWAILTPTPEDQSCLSAAKVGNPSSTNWIKCRDPHQSTTRTMSQVLKSQVQALSVAETGRSPTSQSQRALKDGSYS